jgi:hypothetical protein
MTQREKLLSQLRKRGWREAPSRRSSKYVVLTKDGTSFYYVGKAGALRYGRTIAESYPQDNLRCALLEAHDKEAQS